MLTARTRAAEKIKTHGKICWAQSSTRAVLSCSEFLARQVGMGEEAGVLGASIGFHWLPLASIGWRGRCGSVERSWRWELELAACAGSWARRHLPWEHTCVCTLPIGCAQGALRQFHSLQRCPRSALLAIAVRPLLVRVVVAAVVAVVAVVAAAVAVGRRVG